MDKTMKESNKKTNTIRSNRKMMNEKTNSNTWMSLVFYIESSNDA
jgi:hypothetical protein